MSSSRARSRFAVVAATVPLIAAGGVLVSPASASTASVTPYHSIGADNKVGPNAGFRNPAQGIRGNTAVLKIDVDSASASLDKVDLRLSGYPTGPAIVPDRDFAQTDGFAIYKDVSAGAGNTVGPADGNFEAVDFAQGPVSTGYTLSSPSGGQIPIRIAVDGLRGTGSTRYFVTVHPGNSAGDTENREFLLTLPANGIRFGDTTTGPAQGVSTPKLTIDSKPPIQPARGNFSPKPQPPLERQGATKVEDGYEVVNENNDPDKTLLFLNDGNNVAEANFLRRADASASPAIYGVPTQKTTLFIGDGTGITATSKIARNNQTSDDVYVRAFDTLGNLSAATRLFDALLANTADKVDRSNDVTAPTVSATAAALRTASPAARGVNAANVAAVPTKITYTNSIPTDTAPHNSISAVESRMVVTIGGTESAEPSDITPWASVPPTNATATNAQNVEVPVNTTGVGTTGSQMRVQGRVLDGLGNTTDLWKSASLFTKDLVTPQVTGASFETDEGELGVGEKDDTIRVYFSEPMYKSSIGETGPDNPCDLTAQVDASCVNNRLIFPDGGITWGTNPTVKWAANLTSVLIKLGPTNEPNKRLPELNDRIRATSGVQDPVGNAPVIPTHSDRFISTAPAVPSLATTADTANVGKNLYNQGRDGYLDRITVTFPVALENPATSVPANLANFKIVGSDVRTPISAINVGGTSFTLTFDGTLGSGETPKVVYTEPATGGLKSGGVNVPSFTELALDRAAPAVQLVTTADSDADGKLDRMVAKYSEAINHGTLEESPGTYRVYGYETDPNSTSCPATGIPNVMNPYNTSTQGAPDTTYIAMCEKATSDTAATPSASGGAVEDLAVNGDGASAPNAANGWSTGSNATDTVFNKVLDKAPPVIMSRTTRDLNSDGRLDAIDIVTGETLDGFSVENGRFIVTGRTITSMDILGSTGVRINIEPIPAGLTGDTDAKPTVQYTGGPNGGITDASDQRNSLRADAAPVAPGDGAGPAITGACAGTPANNGKCPLDTATDDKLNVFFSEAVAEADLQNTDFAVEQPTGANKATTAITPSADKKSATLTLANNAIDSTKDATVRFTGAGAVKDGSAQGNTQTASVTAPAPPAVTMNLTCPIAATAGYCGAGSVNTGAVATSGLVRFWRLATTARTNTTPDSEYSTTVPSTYPPAGSILPEGKLTLFLSGKDDYGRLSTEVSKSIEILKAPTLGSIVFKNGSTALTSQWSKTDTMMDGDVVHAEAKVYSSDVASWKPGDTCLANHMSVDYRAITAITSGTTNSAVAPFSCDLNTADAPDSRAMVFPLVKASGTTKFPVGTVVRLNTNDPGAIIVDGPNGTQLRRHFITANARRSHQITDAQVITVPSSLINGIPKGPGMGYRDGSVIKTSTSGYYYMYQNIKRPISGATLKAWGIPTTSVYTVTSGELNAHGTGVGLAGGAHPLGSWVKFSNGSISYITKNAQGVVVRRGLTALAALTSHVPGSQVYKATSQDAAIPFDSTYLRGFRDGTLFKTGTDSFAVISRTVLRPFANTKTFYSMGFSAANARTFTTSSVGRPVTGTYSTGTPIDRYKITSVVIKVTNKAGASVTGVVTPAGIYGVGTLDPIPANWDASRA